MSDPDGEDLDLDSWLLKVFRGCVIVVLVCVLVAAVAFTVTVVRWLLGGV